MIPFDLDDRVIAAAVAAAGTILGALIQLRIAWRKEVSERARGVPLTKKSRRGPVAAVVLLMVAAAVGGFALAQYFQLDHSRLEAAELRDQLQAQLAQFRATAERLEHATALGQARGMRDLAEATATGETAVTTTVGPCRARGTDAGAACAAGDALRATLCASVPAAARIVATSRYVRPEGSEQPWEASIVPPGATVGRTSFADASSERADSERSKQICTEFSTWDSERAHAARLVVTYRTLASTPQVSEAAIVSASAGH